MLPSTDNGDSDIDSKEPKTFVKLRLNRTVYQFGITGVLLLRRSRANGSCFS